MVCRGNAIEELVELKKLQCLPDLRGLVLAGESVFYIHNSSVFVKPVHVLFTHTHTECPLCELDEYRVEVLIVLRKLERLDKDEFTHDERVDAEEVRVNRVES